MTMRRVAEKGGGTQANSSPVAAGFAAEMAGRMADIYRVRVRAYGMFDDASSVQPRPQSYFGYARRWGRCYEAVDTFFAPPLHPMALSSLTQNPKISRKF